jgi:hypothetical protein
MLLAAHEHHGDIVNEAPAPRRADQLDQRLRRLLERHAEHVPRDRRRPRVSEEPVRGDHERALELRAHELDRHGSAAPDPALPVLPGGQLGDEAVLADQDRARVPPRRPDEHAVVADGDDDGRGLAARGVRLDDHVRTPEQLDPGRRPRTRL